MDEGQPRPVESIKQQVRDVTLNVRYGSRQRTGVRASSRPSVPAAGPDDPGGSFELYESRTKRRSAILRAERLADGPVATVHFRETLDAYQGLRINKKDDGRFFWRGNLYPCEGRHHAP